MTVRDTSELLYPSVQETIHALGLGSSDAAAVKLAQRYARTIDGAIESGPRAYTSALRWLGPELQKALEGLGATPAARAALTKGQKPTESKPNGLAALRDAK